MQSAQLPPAGDDDPITLAEACDLIFRGTMTAATLRAEAERGRLTIFKIGKRHYTTRGHVREMIKACRVEPKALGATSIESRGGPSEAERISSARAAL
jgi:hypothetical protein